MHTAVKDCTKATKMPQKDTKVEPMGIESIMTERTTTWSTMRGGEMEVQGPET